MNYLALAKLFTFLANLLLRLAALFLWIVPRFANLSIIDDTTGSFSDATLLSVIARMSLIALRVVLP